MDRTVRIQLKPDQKQRFLLDETGKQFTAVFNAVCAFGWQQDEKNGVRLHHATYYQTRAQYPHLNANLLIQARIKATEALKSAFDRRTKGRKARQPHSKRCPVRYNERTYKLDWASQTVTLVTLEGRIAIPFTIPLHRDCDHVLSKRIVQNAPPGSTIVIENLTHLRAKSKIGGKGKKKDTKRRLHSWSFAQFQSFLVYKAQERGISVVKIDPRHTSQTCSHCGSQHRSNRRSQSLFQCRACGYTLNADLNASYNIRDKHLASLGTSLAGGLPSSSLSSQSSD